VADAFLAAAREGDFDALLSLLDPEVVLRADRAVPAGASTVVRGARAVAGRAPRVPRADRGWCDIEPESAGCQFPTRSRRAKP
jgi:RNA polymerase sigma-70 factor, ECF subfamily